MHESESGWENGIVSVKTKSFPKLPLLMQVQVLNAQ